MNAITRRKAAEDLCILRRKMTMGTIADEWRRVASSGKARKKHEGSYVIDDSSSSEKEMDTPQERIEDTNLALYVVKPRIMVPRSTKLNYRRRRYQRYMASHHPLLPGIRHPELRNLDFLRAPDMGSSYMSLGALVSRWMEFDAETQTYINMPVLEAIQLGQCYQIQIRDAPAEILALIDSGASIFLSRWKAHFPFLMATTMHVQGLGAVSLNRCGPVVEKKKGTRATPA